MGRYATGRLGTNPLFLPAHPTPSRRGLGSTIDHAARRGGSVAVPGVGSPAARRATVMIACPGCGFEAPDDFAFCPKCATELRRRDGRSPEERKIVTTLFCDLVAFTAMSEAADPEDVDRLLGEYFARATKVDRVPRRHRREVHRRRRGRRLRRARRARGRPRARRARRPAPDRGPRGHDPPRRHAPPGALRRQHRRGPGAPRRRPRLRPRLPHRRRRQRRRPPARPPPRPAASPSAPSPTSSPRASSSTRSSPAVAAKGKAEPVAAWLARAPVARVGVDVDRAQLTPLVGREVELAFLQALLEKADRRRRRRSSPSSSASPASARAAWCRSCFADVDSRPETDHLAPGPLPALRRGRHLLGTRRDRQGARRHPRERRPRDRRGQARGHRADGRGPRVAAQPPARAARPRGTVRPSREENFAAWLRFLEEIAASDPTVLVFEDLHWADEALLAFVEHLATHAPACRSWWSLPRGLSCSSGTPRSPRAART